MSTSNAAPENWGKTILCVARFKQAPSALSTTFCRSILAAVTCPDGAIVEAT